MYARKQSPFNAATAYTLANAVTGTYPDYAIDPSKVLISRGSLTPVANATAAVADGNFDFSWDDNSGVGTAKQNDKAIIAIVNSDKGEVITESAGNERMTGAQSFAVPSNWSDDCVDVYLGFISEDGRKIANSLFLGSLSCA